MKYLHIINNLIDKNIINADFKDVIDLASQMGILQSIYYFVKNRDDYKVSETEAYQTSDDDILAWLRLEYSEF